MNAASSPSGGAATDAPLDLDPAYGRMTVILRAGVAVALVLFVGSLAVLAVQQPNASAADLLATPPLDGYFGAAGLAHGLATGSAGAYLTLGVLALVATPVTRVVTGIYYFRATRRRALARLSTAVLALLLLSLFVIGPILR